MMRKKRIFTFVLALVLVMGLGAVTAYGSTTISRYTESTYSHSSDFSNAVIVDGVDVSYVQKNNVDWEEAKANGIDFAIIRVGARGYGEAGRLIEDDYYKENIEEAQAAGIMVGVYFFSQALDEMEAWAEANYTLELIEGYDLDLPVFMDYEYAGGSDGRLTNAQLSKLKMTQNAEKFCETIEEAGYEAGVYANLLFLRNSVNGQELSDKYTVWVAQYNTSNSYQYDYDFWQYSSSGYVDGYSSRLDMDFMYVDKTPEATTSQSLANATASITGASTYTYKAGTSYTPSVRVTYDGKTLTEGVDYAKYYLRNSQAGTAYVLLKGKGSYSDYQLVPFTIQPSSDLSGITNDRILNKYYTGEAREPKSIPMTDELGNELIKDLDYTFSVRNATNVGTATVTITFTGNYTGTKEITYKILKAEQTIKASTTAYNKTVNDSSFTLSGITASAGGALSYKSSDTDVVTVNSAGKVTIVGPGTATITVTAAATDNYKSATLELTVNVQESDQTITTAKDSYSVTQLSKAFDLDASSNVGTELTYKSSDTGVVKVSSDGWVTLMGPGSAEITITAPSTSKYDAATKVIPVTVNPLDEDVYADKYDRIVNGIENTRVVLLKYTSEAKKVKLTWKKSNSGYGVDYYQIWRSTKKSSGYQKMFTTMNKYYINTKNLKASSTYWYKVRGVRNVEGQIVYTDFTKLQVKTKSK